MTQMAGCREVRQALGVYILGAIDPAERSQVDDHLILCHECREELASLAGLPALLRRIPPGEAERLALAGDGDQFDGDSPPEELLHSLLARTATVRRARRWRGVVAAAAVAVLAVGGGAAVTDTLQGAASQHWHRVTAVDSGTGAHLTVKYTPKQWGTMMDVQVSGIEPGMICQFEVTDSSGHQWTVGGWQVYQHDFWYPASTSVRDDNLRSFEVTSGQQVLASVPADPPGEPGGG